MKFIFRSSATLMALWGLRYAQSKVHHNLGGASVALISHSTPAQSGIGAIWHSFSTTHCNYLRAINGLRLQIKKSFLKYPLPWPAPILETFFSLLSPCFSFLPTFLIMLLFHFFGTFADRISLPDLNSIFSNLILLYTLTPSFSNPRSVLRLHHFHVIPESES